MIPRRDQFKAVYDLPSRIQLFQLHIADAQAAAEEYRRQYLHTLKDLRASEHRRVKVEVALAAMRRLNHIIDLIARLSRIKQTRLGLIPRSRKNSRRGN
jgi:hypothetical protein